MHGDYKPISWTAREDRSEWVVGMGGESPVVSARPGSLIHFSRSSARVTSLRGMKFTSSGATSEAAPCTGLPDIDVPWPFAGSAWYPVENLCLRRIRPDPRFARASPFFSSMNPRTLLYSQRIRFLVLGFDHRETPLPGKAGHPVRRRHEWYGCRVIQRGGRLRFTPETSRGLGSFGCFVGQKLES